MIFTYYLYSFFEKLKEFSYPRAMGPLLFVASVFHLSHSKQQILARE